MLLYEIKFLVPNYSCLQNPLLGGYRPQIPVFTVLCPQMNLLKPPPPPNKVPGYSTGVFQMLFIFMFYSYNLFLFLCWYVYYFIFFVSCFYRYVMLSNNTNLQCHTTNRMFPLSMESGSNHNDCKNQETIQTTYHHAVQLVSSQPYQTS